MKTSHLSSQKEHQLIPFPCHQNWEDLDFSESGAKHCSECDCEVRDLTEMSTDEIYALQDELGGKLCGKIHKINNFLVTEVESTHSHSNNNLFPIIPRIIGGSLAALTIASCSSSEVSEDSSSRNEAQAFPADSDARDDKKAIESRQENIPDCILGVIALPPKN